MALRSVSDSGAAQLALAPADRARLVRVVHSAVRRARTSGRALAAVSVRAAPGIDPASVAFASRRPGEPRSGFAPAALQVPEVALARRGGDVRLTLSALATADDTAEDLVARLDARLGELRERELPLLDPAPSGRVRVASAMPPEHYEQA